MCFSFLEYHFCVQCSYKTDESLKSGDLSQGNLIIIKIWVFASQIFVCIYKSHICVMLDCASNEINTTDFQKLLSNS